MASSAPRPGMYGPTGSGPATFTLESGRAPQINAAGPNSGSAQDRATWGVQHPWHWSEATPYHKQQAQQAAIFSIGPWRSGTDPTITKLLSLDQINRICFNSWQNHQRSAIDSMGNTPIEVQLKNKTKKYNDFSEKLYYDSGPDGWGDFSQFGQHNLFSRFLWMSHLSIHHTARYAGPKITISGDGFVPNLACTTVTSGYAQIKNYWGNVRVGQRLYFIIRQSENGKGPFQVIPWAGFQAPNSADLSYVDFHDEVRFGGFWFVGVVNRRPDNFPSEDERLVAAGLKIESPEKTYKIVSNCPHVDIISWVGDLRG